MKTDKTTQSELLPAVQAETIPATAQDIAPTQLPDQFAMMIDKALATGEIEIIERMTQLAERQRDDARRQAFATAMSAAQGEMRTVEKDGHNPQTRSTYSTYAALDRMARPIYSRHGFALSFNTMKSESGPEYVAVYCTVSHSGGWSERFDVDMPADGKGIKGAVMMTRTHAVGSAMQYGRRYLLNLIFNLASGEAEEDDGNAASIQDPDAVPITEEQAMELEQLCDTTGSDRAGVLKIVNKDSFDAVTVGDRRMLQVMFSQKQQLNELKQDEGGAL